MHTVVEVSISYVSAVSNVMWKSGNAAKLKKFTQRCVGVARWWVLWQGNVVSFEVTFEGVKWWWDSDSSKYIVPDLWGSRGESSTFKLRVGFYPGNMQERLARGAAACISNWLMMEAHLLLTSSVKLLEFEANRFLKSNCVSLAIWDHTSP